MTTSESAVAQTTEIFETHRATMSTPRGELSYVDVGPRTGTPAVFVHGVATNAYLWRNVMNALAGEKRCVALDLPIHGQSAPPADGDLSLGAIADTVGAFIDGLDAGPVDLVAHDTRRRKIRSLYDGPYARFSPPAA